MDFLKTVDPHFLLDAITESFIIADASGIIQFHNSASEKLFGYDTDELTGKSINMLMGATDASRHDHYLHQCAPGTHSKIVGSTLDRPLTGKKKNGALFPVDIKITRFEHDQKAHFLAILRDLSEIKLTDDRLQHVLSYTDTVLYTLELSDNQITTKWVSPNIEELLGYSIQEACKPEWWENHLHPADKEQALKNFDQFLQTGLLEHEYRFKIKNGTYIWIQDKLNLEKRADRLIINGSWNNITAKKHLISNLIKNEERLSRSQSFANIGTWDWNIQTGELYWSERIAPLFGHNTGELDTTYENFVNAIHPDDRDKVLDAINRCIEHKEEYNIEHRVVWPDGQVRWLHERGDVIRDENDLPFHMLGVVTDIHEQKILQTKKDQQQNLLNTLHESLTIFTSNADDKMAANLLLDGLLAVTDSEYGFIGEILYNDNQQPYLKTNAITNIAWNKETEKLYNESNEKGFEFTNLDTLFGHVISSGEAVISNHPATDPRSSGLPAGHPSMESFLGVPVYYANNMIGMYGLANCPQGYDEGTIELLKNFSITYASIIHAKRSMQQQEQTRHDLIQAKEQAESANKAKSVFLSSMSHELRTPLNAIIGFSQLIKRETNLNQDTVENIEAVLHSGKHLLNLINEVLDLAKIESGQAEIYLENIYLQDVINECETLMWPLSEQHHVKLSFSTDCIQPIFVRADYTKTKQVLCNLISNAIKYNKKGGHVKIRCRPDHDRIFIHVIDDGYGIAAADIPKLFIPFNRLGNESTSAVEGTGIGLVITKQLLELMSSKLIIDSTPGKGSDFSFGLPLAKEHHKKSFANSRTPEANETSNVSNRKIYYIEDNPANFNLIKQVITRWTDFKFSGTANPVEGIEAIKTEQPDIIFLDINLPEMNGYEVLAHLRENKTCPNAQIFAITANAMSSDAKKIKDAGFDEYFSKPIDIEKLLEKLNTIS